jgi:Domain of unknown function (DUF4202)
MKTDRDSFNSVIIEVDVANSEDPRLDIVDGVLVPRELIYARRMTKRLALLYPEASDSLQIAARAQHICRWRLPRDQYPSGKSGYHAWRLACRKLHASLISELMSKHGYSDHKIEDVCKLIEKQDLKSNPDSQRLENVVGVVFVEYYLDAFSKHQTEEKLVGILRKTTRKMSAEGLQAVRSLKLSPSLSDLLAKALS